MRLRQLSKTEQSSRLTRDHVLWAYRFFLERDPEDETVIDEKLESCATVDDLRREFLRSREFRRQHSELSLLSESLIVIKEIEGFRIFLDLSDLFALSIARGLHEPGEARFVRSVLREGDVALDLGAHMGFFALLMASCVGEPGHVYAFEPCPAPASLLDSSIAENGWRDVVTLERAAVADRCGTTRLVSVRDEVEQALAHVVGAEDVDEAHWETFASRTLALDDYPLRRPVRLVKMDIEGAEPLAIGGARRLLGEDRPLILSEVNPALLNSVSGCTAMEYVRLVEGLGYECRSLDDEGASTVRLRRAPADEVQADEVSSVVFVPR